MVDDFGEKLMHNNERKLRKGGLNMAAFNRRMKFVNVYDQCTRLHVYTVAALAVAERVSVTPCNCHDIYRHT